MPGRRGIVVFVVVGLWSVLSFATELKPATSSAYEHYIAITENRMAGEEGKGNFLVIDGLAPDAKRKAYSDLQNGKLFIQAGRIKEEGHNIPIPDGLTHDWTGIVFIPGANLADTFAFLQDADHYQEIFQPAVRRSRLVSADDKSMKMSEQFYHKTIVTVAVNTDFDVHYAFLDDSHLVCQAHSIRVAEVEHVGQADEHEMPVGNDHGYLWRMNTYWHVQKKDGGVYLQVQTVALTRNVPVALEWVVGPLIKSIPRGTLSTFLTTARTNVSSRRLEKTPTETSAQAGSATSQPKGTRQ